MELSLYPRMWTADRSGGPAVLAAQRRDDRDWRDRPDTASGDVLGHAPVLSPASSVSTMDSVSIARSSPAMYAAYNAPTSIDMAELTSASARTTPWRIPAWR